MLRSRPVCRRRLEQDGSERQAECHQRCLDYQAKPTLRPVSLVCRSGGDRAPSRAGLLNRRRSLAGSGRAVSIISRKLRRNAAISKRRARSIARLTAQWRAPSELLAVLGQAKLLRSTRHWLNLCGGTTVRRRCRSKRGPCSRPGRALERPPAWTTRKGRRWANNARSPEQIARRLSVDFPDDETMRISHEAIYQALFVQGRGALRRDLTACLRSGRALRVPRARTRGRGKTFISPEIMISQRPAEATDRAVPGHWEGDLILELAVPRSAHHGESA